jgi:TM2 domain-containing membrane protein YozV
MQGYPPNPPPPPPGTPPGSPYAGYGPPPPAYPPQPPYGGQYGMMNPHAPYGVDPKTGLPYSEKKKMVAGLLQILVGSFAVGRFYTGHIGIAIAQICVVYLTCGVGLLWPLIDGILMLTGDPKDAEGRPLRDG